MSDRVRNTCPRLLKFDAKLPVIVDLTVKDDPEAAGGIRHRLCSALGVNHAETRVAKMAACQMLGCLRVGAAMRERGRHSIDRKGRRLCRAAVENDGDSAHISFVKVNEFSGLRQGANRAYPASRRAAPFRHP